MAHLYRDVSINSLYTDRKFSGGKREWQTAIEESTTVYVGNLSFYTTEEQIYSLFERAGEVKRVIMGLDRNTKTPCGFCFVEYHSRTDTEDAVRYVGGNKLDDRIVRVDWDGGFVEGRQYGRGRSGGQVREEYRTDFDAGRGGWGKAVTEPAPYERQPSSAPAHAPMRMEGRGSSGGAARDQEAPAAKRQKEANPRFREDKEDEEDDD